MAAREPRTPTAVVTSTTTTEVVFKDFDTAVYEVESKIIPFRYEGEDFTADLNVDAGAMLVWMRSGGSVNSIPEMLTMLVGKLQYERMLALNGSWTKMQAVIEWLSGELGGSGN